MWEVFYMVIKWLGHACFCISSQEGTRILMDPFDSSVGYPVPSVDADIVTTSHSHHDHNYTQAAKGDFEVIDKPGTYNVKGIEIKGTSTFHDGEGGKKRGTNTVFTLNVDGLRVCHLGDLGHTLTDEQVKDIGNVDILLVPVGGFFTIDASQAATVAEQLGPKVIIPMHYKTEVINFPIAGVEEFTRIMGGFSKVDSQEISISKENIDKLSKVVVLNYK